MINTTRNTPQKYKKLYVKALAKKSRKAAIRSFCLECMCYYPDEVKRCTDDGCPLYKYRING